MTIGGVRALGSIDPRTAYGGQQGPATAAGFGEQLQAAIRAVDAMQGERDGMVREMVRGAPVEVHEIMTVAQEAQLAFELMLEIRNKLLESYQDIMRMHI
jgi:flagellar hook-basal body complex protein FliE